MLSEKGRGVQRPVMGSTLSVTPKEMMMVAGTLNPPPALAPTRATPGSGGAAPAAALSVAREPAICQPASERFGGPFRLVEEGQP